MRSVIYSLLLAAVSASPVPDIGDEVQLLQERQDNSNSSSLLPYSLPSNGPDVVRAADITTKQLTFTYGPPIGVGPYYPAGVLGTTYATTDGAIDDAELAAQVTIMRTDDAKARLDSAKYNGLKTLDDYTKLYDGEWQPSSQPTGQYDGILTNYTQDLLFSMERLSFNPYAVRRLNPSSDSIPFEVDDAIVSKVTGQTLESLFTSGRLFYVDHTVQGRLAKTPPPQYAPACDALFYICPSSGDFLPLAIRTGVSNNLVYTPEDTADDWLLAKIMFNVNDFFMAQFDHFSRNHFVAEIVYEAAVRTLSDSHPVLAILKRLLYGAFGIRPLALVILIRPGGDIDQYFGNSGAAAAQFANETYFNGSAGALRSNYFLTNLEKRGLINSPVGPALKSFPFYEDATPIYNAIRDFTGTFISSYYSSDAAISSDKELQAWVKEANGPAGVIDFPTIKTRSDLATLLAEIGRLVSFSHHAVNLNQLITVASTLPFHPTALYKPIPTAKNVTDVASYLPPLDKALGFIGVAANFARPLLANTNRSLINMFDDPIMLHRMNSATRAANEKFKSAMTARSEVVRNRGFDANGLSQGMPFVWQALDPGVAAWSLTI